MLATSRYPVARRLVLFGCVVALVVSFLPIAVVSAAPKTWWVDDTGNNANAGTEAAPFRAITYAMTQAVSGDTIMVKPGTYDAPDETFPIALKSGVRLTSQSGAGVTTVHGNAPSTVISVVDAGTSTELSGFTITGGAAPSGAGIFITLTSSQVGNWPLIQDNIIEDMNVPGSLGTGIYMTGGVDWVAPIIIDNVFRQNVGSGGSGIYCGTNTGPWIQDNLFVDNRATIGGGIYVGTQSVPHINGNTFIGNVGSSGAGAIFTALSAGVFLDMSDCVFTGNRTEGAGDGGAVWVGGMGASVRLMECTFSSNIAGGDGGAVVAKGATARVWNSILRFNRATGEGGAVYIDDGNGYVENCTIWGNYGAHAVTRAAGYCLVLNSIVGGHNDKDIFSLNVKGSLIEDTDFTGDAISELGGVIHGDPKFIDQALGDYQLRADSPCIDTASSNGDTVRDILGVPRPLDGDGDGVAGRDMGAYEHPVPEIGRYAGTNRYTTACEIAEDNWGSVDTVVIASGENFPDALSAAGLAGCYECPLLLVKKDSVPNQVLATLERLGARSAVIVGGPAVVSAAVVSQLENAALEEGGLDVARIYGNDRYQTSAAVARAIYTLTGKPSKLFFARGDAFPDALAVSPFAYRGRAPILLTKPDTLPSSIAAVVKDADFDVKNGYVCGGTAAVSESVADQIESLMKPGTFSKVERWAGKDRYATAVAVAEGADGAGFGGWGYVGIATGENFPDALAGGPAAGANDGCVLLTKTATLSPATAAALRANKNEVLYTKILGGTSAVSDGVKTAVESALGW